MNGATVLMTGAAGGLGRALAHALHARGARLALVDMDLGAAQGLASALDAPSAARAWQADVRDLAQMQRVCAEVHEHFGQIDVVVAGAGITTMAPIQTIEPEAWDRVIDINLHGVWRTFRAALPYVRDRQGYLLAISSMAAFVHSPLQASYAASKAAVWALCDSTRLELRHEGIAVGSLHPTFFPTAMMDDVVADPAGQRVWGGNRGGVWGMTSIDGVVRRAVRMIERRSQMATVPARITPIAKAPWLFRPSIERLGFRGDQIQRAVEAADPTGWHDASTQQRTGATTHR